MNPDPADNIIRITHDEAASPHVDDLLKRQMSLRGEPGVTRGHGHRWFYQNWFVFSLVGLLAAVAAWAIIEPYFADMLYLQGPIEKISSQGSITESSARREQLDLHSHEAGWIQIKGEKIWMFNRTTLLEANGNRKHLSFDDLAEGQQLGVYVKHIAFDGDEMGIAYYATKTLKKQSPAIAAMGLQQLSSRANAAALLLFPVVAGLVGLAIGSADGIICRLPRRALLCGIVGLLVGFIGGFFSHLLAGLVYTPITNLAQKMSSKDSLSTVGFILQMIGRSLAWALAGSTMGLGQGIALRSKRLLLYGLLGGIIGGLLGGLLFDPIDELLLGRHNPGAPWSRLIGLGVVGLSVGALIGLVELFARDAWLRMTHGPLAGKEFLLFKDVMNIGSSPRSDIYLFNDPLVIGDHAILRAVGDECEIESRQRDNRVLLNNRAVTQARLRHGDQVTIGRTMFVFEKRHN